MKKMYFDGKMKFNDVIYPPEGVVTGDDLTVTIDTFNGKHKELRKFEGMPVRITIELNNARTKNSKSIEKNVIKNVTQVLDLAEREGIPAHAKKWATSAMRTAQGIMTTIKEMDNKATDKQIKSLRNINDAAMRWLKK